MIPLREKVGAGCAFVLSIVMMATDYAWVSILLIAAGFFIILFEEEKKHPLHLRPWVKKCFRKKPEAPVNQEVNDHTAQQPAPAPEIPQPAHPAGTGDIQKKTEEMSMAATVIVSEEVERGLAGKIHCKWPDRTETDLNEINRILSKRELSSLKILDYETYLQTKTTPDNRTGETTVSYRMGLDSLVLHVIPANLAERYRYQIGIYSVEDAELFDRNWKQAHPDQVMHCKIVIKYSCGHFGVLVAYHAHTACKPEKNAAADADISSSNGITYALHSDGTMCIIDGSRASGGVVIPEIFDGYPVTKIRAKAFAGNDKLTRICISRSIRSIEAEAFRDCHNLFDIEIPAGVAEIGTDAFKHCGRKEDEELSRGMTAHSRRDLEYMFGWGYEAVESKMIAYQTGVYDGYLYEITAAVARGSYAEAYCKKNNIKYRYMAN